MEVDINEPKSKAFNVFLRMFQLGCQLIIAYWTLKSDGIQGCEFTIPNITSYIAYALAAINLISVIGIRCSNKFPRCFFFVTFILDLIMAITVIAINAAKGYDPCAAGKVFYHFSIIESGIAIVISFVILVMRLGWGQRYSNSPGNLVWPPLFLPFEWSPSFRVYMQIIGIVTAIVSVITFFSSLSTLAKTSTTTRKIVTFGWVFGLVLLLLMEGLAIFKYLTAGDATQYIDAHAKKTLAVFIGVNALDILFWIWGMKTLDYEKGDQVRQDLFGGKEDFSASSNPNRVQKSVIVQSNFGTIKK